MKSEASITNDTERFSSLFDSTMEADPFMEVSSSPLSSPSTDSAKSFSSVTSPCDSLLCSPYIDLDEKHFVNNKAIRMFNLYGHHIEANNVKKSGRDAFISHARWLQQNYQQLKVARLRLCFSNPSEYTNDAMEWIRMATTRDVEELDIDFSIPDNDRRYPECFKSYAELPPEVYMLRNCLHALRLSGCRFQPALFGKFSAVLRKLSIERVQFDAESLQVLIANCWHLEDLKLKMLGHLTNINLNDFRHRIKRVTIEECSPMMEANIVMPGLQYFKYSGIAVPVVIKDYYTIEEAELDFSQQFELGHHGELISEILICLQNARVLTMCSYVTRVIGSENIHLPTIIVRLPHLILMKATLHKDESTGIIFLLASYPMLETLTINMGYQTQLAPRILRDEEYFSTPFDAKGFWEAQTSPIICLDMYLKKVNIMNFRGHKNEVYFLKYLLKKSSRLEELSITIASDMSDWENLGSCISAAQQLQHCEKASPNVQISIR